MTDVETASHDGAGTDLVLYHLEDVQRALLTGVIPEVVGDPVEMQRAIMARILSAESVADVLDTGSGLESWGDLEGVSVEVRDVRFNISTYEEGPPVYAVVDLIVTEGKRKGERTLVSCGGTNVMAQLVALAKMGAFPLTVKLTRSERPTKAGFRPLWLQGA